MMPVIMPRAHTNQENGHPRGLVDLENFDPRYGTIVPSPTAVVHAIGGWCMLDRSVQARRVATTTTT